MDAGWGRGTGKSEDAASEKKPGRRGVRFWAVIVGVTAAVFVAAFWGGRELRWRFLVRCVLSEKEATRRIAFWELLRHNNVELEFDPGMRREHCPVEASKAPHRKMGDLYCVTVQEPEEEMTGPRGSQVVWGPKPRWNYLFNSRGECLFQTTYDGLGAGRLGDVTGDGDCELMVDESKFGRSWARLQVFAIEPEGMKRLLDAKYEERGRMCIRREGEWLGASICLAPWGDVEKTAVWFHWNAELGRFEAKGEKSPDWEMLFPKEEK